MPSFDSRDFWLRGNNGMNAIEAQRQRRPRLDYIATHGISYEQAREALSSLNTWAYQDWDSYNRVYSSSIRDHVISRQQAPTPQNIGVLVEDWPSYIEQLYEGCTLELRNHPVYPNIKGTVTNNQRIYWDGYRASPTLSEVHLSDLRYFFNIKHLDGTPFVLKQLSTKDRVLNKIKLLETKFKTKTLRKTKNKALPLPA